MITKKHKVFNFEVEGWHTYFVGILAWLVHNAAKCITTTIKEISKRLKYLGRTPGKASKAGREVFERMKTQELLERLLMIAEMLLRNFMTPKIKYGGTLKRQIWATLKMLFHGGIKQVDIMAQNLQNLGSGCLIQKITFTNIIKQIEDVELNY